MKFSLANGNFIVFRGGFKSKYRIKFEMYFHKFSPSPLGNIVLSINLSNFFFNFNIYSTLKAPMTNLPESLVPEKFKTLCLELKNKYKNKYGNKNVDVFI